MGSFCEPSHRGRSSRHQVSVGESAAGSLRVLSGRSAVNPPWALASGCASSLLEPGIDSCIIDGEDLW